MRFFSTIVASTLFAFSAHAAISNDVASCISKINDVTKMSDTVSKGPNLSLVNTLSPLIKEATIICSLITRPINVESADALLVSYGTLPPTINSLTTAIKSQPGLRIYAFPPLHEGTVSLARAIEIALPTSPDTYYRIYAGYIPSIKKSFEDPYAENIPIDLK